MIAQIKNKYLEVSAKTHGAELTSIKKLDGCTEFLWQGDEAYWSSRSPILFPIVGGLPDGKYEVNHKIYNVEAHGFAKDSEFLLVAESETELKYKLEYNENTLKQYPWKFELIVTYSLENNRLHHGFEVMNIDNKEMYFSLGAHAGFNCPVNGEQEIKDYCLVFEKSESLLRRIKSGGLLTGEKQEFTNGRKSVRLDHSMFYNDAIILDSMKSNWIELTDFNDISIRVEFKGFPYLGIWSSRNDGPFICIEPWFGIDSTAGDSYDFTKKEGIQKLAPGEIFQCQYSIVIS